MLKSMLPTQGKYAQTTLHGVNNTHIEERMCKYRAGDRFMPGVLKFMRIAARN